MVDKKTILEMNDLPLEEVKMKEWGTTVFIRPITLEERILWENSIDPKDYTISALTLLVYSICNEDGSLIFSEKDIPELRKKNSAPIMRLFKIARRVSKLREKDIEEEIKNLDAAQPG